MRAYSLGMRQRLGLAGALLRRPRLLVLDEPTNGLDPQGIHEIRELLLELNRAGTTVFLSSHLLAEVEQLCTRVGVLDRGRLVLQDDLATLQRAHRPRRGAHARTSDAARRAARRAGSSPTRSGFWCAARPGRAQRPPGRARASRCTSSPPDGRRLEEVVLAARRGPRLATGRPGRT